MSTQGKPEQTATNVESSTEDSAPSETLDGGNEAIKAVDSTNVPTVHDVLLDAERKIDEHLDKMQRSRRLYCRDSCKSWANLTTSLLQGDMEALLAPHDSEDTDDDVDAANDQYRDFLASQPTIKLLQQCDVVEAEEHFYREETKASGETTESDPLSPRFKIQLFNPLYYDNVEHTWDKRAFTVESMHTFFGTIREDRMDKLIKSKRSKIAKNGSWDPEGLVLTELGRPFRCKLYFSVNDEDNLPNNFKVVHFSGIWLTKVYSGEYGKFLDWVDDSIKYVKEKYDRKVNAHRNFFAYYPSSLENQKSSDESIVVFFIKVSD